MCSRRAASFFSGDAAGLCLLCAGMRCRSEPDRALIASPAVPSIDPPLAQRPGQFVPFLGGGVLVVFVSHTHNLPGVCVAVFQSPLMLVLFSSFYYLKESSSRSYITYTQTTHAFILFSLENDFGQKLLDR